MTPLVMPRNLVESVRSDDEHPERREWVAQLPSIVLGLAERWSLDLGEPYQPGGQCSWVAPVRGAAGQELVLKVGWRHPEAEGEAEGLRAWNGRGTVLIYDAEVFDTTSALLLERCLPGTTMATTVTEPEQDGLIADLLHRLWRVPVDGLAISSLQAMCDAWSSDFAQRLTTTPAVLDPGLARAGIELLRELPRNAERQVLLHTDLHAENIVAAQREPWLVMDPKPHIGDPAYDTLQHLFNCDRLDTDPGGLARRFAELLELDTRRVTQWLFARCIVESIDQPALGLIAATLAPA